MIYIVVCVSVLLQLIVSLLVGFNLKKKGRQEIAARILGIVSFVCHSVFAVLSWLVYCSYTISFVLLACVVVELVLAICSVKSRVCRIALILFGILTSSLFDFIGGIFALSRASVAAPPEESFLKMPANGADLKVADGQTLSGKDSTQAAAERRAVGQSGKQYDSKPLPITSERWFTDRGVRLVRMPIKKRDIRGLSGDEKRMICFTTFPSVFKALIFVSGLLGAVVAVALIAFLIGLISDSVYKGAIYLAVVLGVSLIGGSFIVNPWSRILDGFNELLGTRALNLPTGYKIWLFIITPLALLWGYFSTMIFTLIGRDNSAKARSLPTVIVPDGYGFDDMVEFYAEYEAECRLRDAKNAKMEEARRIHEDGVKIYDKAVEDVRSDPTKNYIEKAEEMGKLDKEKQKLDKNYEEIKKKYE